VQLGGLTLVCQTSDHKVSDSTAGQYLAR